MPSGEVNVHKAAQLGNLAELSFVVEFAPERINEATSDTSGGTQTIRHDTLMVGKQRERAIKRNNLAVAQQYPVMLVLGMPTLQSSNACTVSTA